jgi:hypothetical protein
VERSRTLLIMPRFRLYRRWAVCEYDLISGHMTLSSWHTFRWSARAQRVILGLSSDQHIYILHWREALASVALA